MIDMEAKEIVDNEYEECENCGELTHMDDMCSVFAFNGMESWGEALTSHCFDCEYKG